MFVTLGKRLDALREDRSEKTHLGDALDRCFLCLACETAQFSRKIKKALHGHIRVEGGVLGQIAKKPLRHDGIFGYIESTDRYASFRRRNKAGDHPHGGRFPCAVGLEKADRVALSHGKREVVQRDRGDTYAL